jgi:DNA polymerase I-like protein with 3'-5' exonuclease and polymerase domains
MKPLQLPLYPPKSDWVAPSLSALPSWAEAGRVAVDVETCDPQISTLGPGVRRRGCYVCGVSFAIEDGPAFYLPIRHYGGGNLPEEQVWAYLRAQAAVFKGDLAGANLQYDTDWCLENGVEFHPRYFRDIQVAEPLIDELQLTYSLDDVAKRWGLPGKDTALRDEAAKAYGVDPHSEMYKLPPEYVAVYGEQDVRLPLQLLRRQEAKIEEEDLWDIYNLESELLPVLVRMRRRGVRIDYDQLDQVERWSVMRETDLLEEVHRLTQVRVGVGDVMKPEPMAKVLRSIGVDVPLTPSTKKPSVTKELLESIKHPVAALLRNARQANKVRTTFVESVRTHAINGRIHCTFKQLRGTESDDREGGDEGGGRFGRLSCTDPNLQQQPARHPEIGPMWRKIYIPDEGGEWMCADYSQQEPRWLTHYAELTGCQGAHDAAERYRTDPNTDNHQMMSDLTGIPRKRAKDLFLGKCYGMGGAKLCHSLGLPTEYIERRGGGGVIEVAGPEGQAIIDQFDARCPYVKQVSYKCEQKATKFGFIRTVLGRRCRFPKVGETYDWTYKALNRLIQGSSADQTKKAVIEADRAGHPLQLQVHDELDMTVYDRAKAEELAEIMRSCVVSNIPFKVDVEYGDSWGAILLEGK